MAITLKAILGFDGKAYEAGLRKATATSKKAQKNIASNLKGAILGTLSVGYMAAKAKEIGEFAREVRDLAPALGMSTDELQQWEYVFARFGLELQDTSDAFATLADRTEDALAGTESMIEDFRLIGISVDQLRGKNPQQLFELFADGVSKTTDKNRALTAIVRNLGDDLGRKLAPALMLGSKGLAEMRKEAQDLGIVMDSDNIREVADRVIEMQIASMKLRSFWADITYYASKFVTYLSDGIRALNPFTRMFAGMGAFVGTVESGGSVIEGWKAYAKAVGQVNNELLEEVENREKAEKKRRKEGKGGGGLTRSTAGINDEIEAKKAQAALQKKINDAAFREMSKEQQLNSLFEQRLRLFEQIRKASGKQKFELMGQDFDLMQQMKGIEGTTTTATARRAMAQTSAQGVGAFVRRANPMLQVAREQLNVQRQSKAVLESMLAARFRPTNSPY